MIDRLRRIASNAAAADTIEQRRELILAWARRIEVGREWVKIAIASASEVDVYTVRSRMAASDVVETRDHAIEIAVPIRLKTWGGEKVIEGPNGGAAYDAIQMDPTLINAISQAYQWRNALAANESPSLEGLATAAGQTEAYVRQVLPLAFLAPDIVESILLGKQPRHLTVDRLVRMKLPLSWQAQRRILNIAI